MNIRSISDPLGIEVKALDGDLNSIPKLNDTSVHLWCLPLIISDAQADEAKSLLNAHQLEKYQRRDQQARKIYLASRHFLRTLLAAYLKQEPQEIQLEYNRLGKPRVEDDSLPLRFNFSDTMTNGNAYGIFALTLNHEIGVDIENLNRSNNFQRIAKRRFSQQERDYLSGDEHKIRQRFLRIWTRKEAYGKATGVGINFKMNLENTYSETNDHAFQDSKDHAWRLQQFIYSEQNLIACAVRESSKPFTTQCFTSLRSLENQIP